MSKLIRYITVSKGGQGEIVEKKSRFIATVRPVSSEEEALAFIAEMPDTIAQPTLWASIIPSCAAATTVNPVRPPDVP